MRFLSIIIFLAAALDVVAQDYSIKGKVLDSICDRGCHGYERWV